MHFNCNASESLFHSISLPVSVLLFFFQFDALAVMIIVIDKLSMLISRTFWSESLNDTLTTASPSGLAWAKDPANGYQFLGTEGYCLSQQPPVPARSPQLLVAVQYTQLWSDDRHDSFLVSVGGSHEATGTSTSKVVDISEYTYNFVDHGRT